MTKRTYCRRAVRFLVILFLVLGFTLISNPIAAYSKENSFYAVNINSTAIASDMDLLGKTGAMPEHIFIDCLTIDANGNLTGASTVNTQLINKLHSQNVKVIGVLKNAYKYDGSKNLFMQYRNLSQSIYKFLTKNRLDGININTAGFSTEDSKRLSELVKALRGKLGNKKLVTVTLNPSDLAAKKPGIPDIKTLAGYSDYLVLNNIVPSVLEKTIQYILQSIPKQKLALKIPPGNSTDVQLYDIADHAQKLVVKYGIKGLSFTTSTDYSMIKQKESANNNNPGGNSKNGKENPNKVYLTFDDGPDTKITPQILDVLKEYNVKATFFVNGVLADKNPQIIKRISEEGHSIGNHSYSHKTDYIYLSWENLKGEIEKTNKTIFNLTGKECVLFRAPGGSKPNLKKEYLNGIHEMGMKVFDWNCDTRDWENGKNSVSDIITTVKNTPLKENMIVIMHSRQDRQNTLEALPEIIEYFRQKNYDILPITEDTKEVIF